MQEVKGITKQEYLNHFYQQEYYKLSLRAQNILEDIDIVSFSSARDYYFIHRKKIDFMHVRNVGVKTNAELIRLFTRLEESFDSKNEIVEVPDDRDQTGQSLIIPVFNNRMELAFRAKLKELSSPTKAILKLKNAHTIQGFYHYFFIINPGILNFNISKCGAASKNEIVKFKKIVEEIFVQYKSDFIPSGLFSDLEFYFRHPDFLKEYRREIFNRCLNIYEGEQCQSNEEAGKDLNLTNTKVRQVINEMPIKIREVVVQLTKNGYLDTNQYFKDDYFIIDEQYVRTINEKEGTNFSKHLICYALSHSLTDDYGYYGIQNKLSKYSGIFYRKDLLLNIYACLHLISELRPDQRKRAFIRIALENILEQTGIKKEPQEMNVSFLRAKNQLLEIIGLYNNCLPGATVKVIVDDNYLIFKTKSVNHIYENVIEALRASKKPMHFREIYKRLIENNKFVSSVKSLHSLIMFHSEHFVLKGPGYYGLREWGGYFGKIPDIAEQILMDRNAPMPREELLEILCREHHFSRESVINVLFHYRYKHRFVKYNDNTIGLTSWIHQ
jgi:hypothetical protein